MIVHDQFHDPSFRVLKRLAQEYPDAVGFTKTAEVDTTNGGDLPDRAFAWPEERRYPIHTKEHAALSVLYRTKCASVPSHVEENLKKAQDIYDLDAMPMEKVAAAPRDDSEEYLIPSLKRFRVKTAAEVLPAAYALQRHYRKMDIPTRALACTRLLKIAQANGIELPPTLQKMAGVTVSSAPRLLEALEVRKEASAQNPIVQAGFQKMAALVASLPPDEFQNPEVLRKIAGGLTELDGRAGLAQHYDKTIPDPLQSVYNTEKTAEPMLPLAGHQVPVTRLMGIDKEAYADAFGPDFVGEVFKEAEADPSALAQVLPTMPRDLQSVLYRNVFGVR